jgi:hypothetical protein
MNELISSKNKLFERKDGQDEMQVTTGMVYFEIMNFEAKPESDFNGIFAGTGHTFG